MSSTIAESAPVKLPTKDELNAVVEKLREANDALCGVKGSVRHIAKHWGRGSGFDDGDEKAEREFEVPTFEHIGILFSYGDLFRSYLNEMDDYVKHFEGQSLRSLDIVRSERGGDA